MQSYRLVNPKIIGDFNDTFDAIDQKIAADKTWQCLTKYMTKNIPEFLFTLEDKKTGKLYNFQVNESIDGKIANYDIIELEPYLNQQQINLFKKMLNKIEEDISPSINITGGKKLHIKYDDNDNTSSSSSSSSDSSTDRKLFNKIRLFKATNTPQPIVYYWYTPQIYSPSRLPSIFIPTFIPPLLPYIEINLSSAWLG